MNQNKNKINVKLLSTGIYYLQISFGDTKTVQKFVKA
ncbi:MAG: T9SS type A sorting domain-containing protein, partial [Chitinophagales bacterium]|nr:T9SS type A sorting domain-containing protein [Chitinophagales bacterium]